MSQIINHTMMKCYIKQDLKIVASKTNTNRFLFLKLMHFFFSIIIIHAILLFVKCTINRQHVMYVANVIKIIPKEDFINPSNDTSINLDRKKHLKL